MLLSRFIVPLLLLTIALDASDLSGSIIDAESGEPLPAAIIEIVGTAAITAAGDSGSFRFSGIPPGRYRLRATHVGYASMDREIVLGERHLELGPLRLVPVLIHGQRVMVISRARSDRDEAVVFSTLSRDEIERDFHTQDIPVMLSKLPSTTFYSESGHGVGYTYMSIRGFDQRRLSVMINGVPQNDPEDHNTYWVDLPGFLDNVEDVQVHRGAGGAFHGPPAIGGSVNIVTSRFSPERRFFASTGGGSYGTRKHSLSLNSGLIGGEYVLFGRVSQIVSDGYRDRSWVDFKSFFLGAARFGERSSTQVHVYGGPIEDGLAFFGISREEALDPEKRRNNPLLRDDEIENFNQPHLDLIHHFQLSDRLSIHNTFFGIRGRGFFDYDGSWAPLSYFRLTPELGFNVSGDPGSIFVDDLLIRAFVDNRQIGWLPHITWRGERFEATVGAELRGHRSLHWGRIQSGSNALPDAVSGEWQGRDYIGERRYYEYRGGVDVWSPFVHTAYEVNNRVALRFDLQLANSRYQLYDEAFLGTDFTLDYHFLNPRLGAMFELTEALQLFGSIAHTGREPRLKSHYDAAEASTPESWGPVVPRFEVENDGSYDFDEPLVKPERLTDFELGLRLLGNSGSLEVNAYYMDFRDEIVKTGQLDRFGQPITGNAAQSVHAGIEISAAQRLTTHLRAEGNLSWSRNRLRDYQIFDGTTPVSLDGNTIAGFPSILGNGRVIYEEGNFTLTLAARHVGKFYTDNFMAEANSVDAHTLLSGMAGYRLSGIPGLRSLVLRLHVENVFDRLYIAHGEGAQFFPGAERHFFISGQVEL